MESAGGDFKSQGAAVARKLYRPDAAASSESVFAYLGDVLRNNQLGDFAAVVTRDCLGFFVGIGKRVVRNLVYPERNREYAVFSRESSRCVNDCVRRLVYHKPVNRAVFSVVVGERNFFKTAHIGEIRGIEIFYTRGQDKLRHPSRAVKRKLGEFDGQSFSVEKLYAHQLGATFKHVVVYL